jgi:hypothetical protein
MPSVTGEEIFMFYNCENLFDTKNDTLKDDEEFLPGGARGWNNSKYYRKVNAIAKVILSAGTWDPPALVGLCEVENEEVIANMLKSTSLSRHDYRVACSNSTDSRGIDVCLLYRESVATLLFSGSYYPVAEPGDSVFSGRPVLYAKLKIHDQILHVMINHWPSRRGGVLNGQPVRAALAERIVLLADSIRAVEGLSAAIIIAGDFNCNPGDNEMKILGKARFTNLASPSADAGRGTYRYRGVWYMFDQILISDSSESDQSTLSFSDFSIHNPDMLMTDDVSWPGKRPFSTYSNFNYTGGFSDHLPVKVNVNFIMKHTTLW